MDVLEKILQSLANLLNVKRKSENKLTIEITLKTNQQQYRLDQYQRLNNTQLMELLCPMYPNITASPTNKAIASDAAYEGAYITLLNVRSEAILDDVPLGEYIDSTNNWPTRGQFNLYDIDWTKSYIRYPSTTIPNANNDKSILIRVKYRDACEPLKAN